MKSKHELVEDLKDVFGRWETFLRGRSEQDLTTRPPSGKMSVAEVVTHMMAWQQLSIARLDAARLDTAPRYPAWLEGADPFFADDHADEFNARIRQLHQGEPWETRYREWKEGFERLLALAESIPESDLSAAGRYPWLRGDALAAVLEGSFEHHCEHLERIDGNLP
jgi:hypothetical protein